MRAGLDSQYRLEVKSHAAYYSSGFFMGALHQINLFGTESLKNGALFYCCSASFIENFSLFQDVFEDHV